ncbi:unnamed protein product [Didymodactylos carnosus]|uniref:Uncharacterized protein n=1 Tax=Didymodactylos carnosus TaxID=1234261 RepID=A0A814D7Y8_9BILA|nr:unnamed protein product [Didymodactylos carnosus]CAF1159371.1 unnamed protein product [Didymodactylos carnosus]CAF3729984.1 unnamed protein product [Didymodactylos carnosus]CAF3970931.1 unnamed protein product [Didymodactylos carnosus]
MKAGTLCNTVRQRTLSDIYPQVITQMEPAMSEKLRFFILLQSEPLNLQLQYYTPDSGPVYDGVKGNLTGKIYGRVRLANEDRCCYNTSHEILESIDQHIISEHLKMSAVLNPIARQCPDCAKDINIACFFVCRSKRQGWKHYIRKSCCRLNDEMLPGNWTKLTLKDLIDKLKNYSS